jgi:hypothetical protein
MHATISSRIVKVMYILDQNLDTIFWENKEHDYHIIVISKFHVCELNTSVRVD